MKQFILWSPGLILLVCISLLLLKVDARLPNGQVNPGDKYTVCTATIIPYGACTLGDQNLTSFQGYSVEMFKRVAAGVGWTPEDYSFLCLPKDEMVEDLTSPTGVCDIASSSTMVELARIEQGIKFAYPDFNAGQALMVYAPDEKPKKWLFLRPFSWLVWLFLLLASFAVAASIRAVEWVLHSKREACLEGACNATFCELVWSASAQVVSASDPIQAMSLPSRIIIFVWAFLILLLVAMYTGNAAAILTASKVNVQVTSIQDLQGQAWGAYSGTVARLQAHGWFPTVLFPSATSQALVEEMLNQLSTGALAGLVWDCGLVGFITATRCNYVQVSDCISRDNRALAFWSNASNALVGSFSRAVLILEENSDLGRLHSDFLQPKSDYCSDLASSNQDQLNFHQVSGLWIILSFSIACALIMACCIRYHSGAIKVIANRFLSSRNPRATPAGQGGHERELRRADKSNTGNDMRAIQHNIVTV